MLLFVFLHYHVVEVLKSSIASMNEDNTLTFLCFVWKALILFSIFIITYLMYEQVLHIF